MLFFSSSQYNACVFNTCYCGAVAELSAIDSYGAAAELSVIGSCALAIKLPIVDCYVVTTRIFLLL